MIYINNVVSNTYIHTYILMSYKYILYETGRQRELLPTPACGGTILCTEAGSLPLLRFQQSRMRAYTSWCCISHAASHGRLEIVFIFHSNIFSQIDIQILPGGGGGRSTCLPRPGPRRHPGGGWKREERARVRAEKCMCVWGLSNLKGVRAGGPAHR